MALDVLKDRELKGLLAAYLTADDRYKLKAGERGGAPPALPRDDLIAPALNSAHHDRLDHTVHLKRGGELLERLFVKALTRLRGVWVDQVARHLNRRRAHRGARDQRADPAPSAELARAS